MDFSDVRIKEIEFVVHYRPKLSRFTARNRTNHILGIQLSGAAVHRFRDRSFTLEAGCIYFFNQQEDYEVEVMQGGDAFSVHFTTFAPIEIPSFCLPVKETEHITRALGRIEQSFCLGKAQSVALFAQVYHLLSLYEGIMSKGYHSSDDRLHAAKVYIEGHFKEKDCLMQAARQYGVTQRRFCDLFRWHYDMTPHQYIVDCKMKVAQKLLALSALSITEVAALSGYEEVYYFSKSFKKMFGRTPSEYRKSIIK